MPIKHHEDWDQYRATLASEGPYGNPYIEPMDYSCNCDDWLDDKADFAGESAFITVLSESGHYTDFRWMPTNWRRCSWRFTTTVRGTND